MQITQSIGSIKVKALYIPSSEIVEAIIVFENSGDKLYYCWAFKDTSGLDLGGKCLPISKRIIDTDQFEFAINHSIYSINNCRIGRQKVFVVKEIEKL